MSEHRNRECHEGLIVTSDGTIRGLFQEDATYYPPHMFPEALAAARARAGRRGKFSFVGGREMIERPPVVRIKHEPLAPAVEAADDAARKRVETKQRQQLSALEIELEQTRAELEIRDKRSTELLEQLQEARRQRDNFEAMLAITHTRLASTWAELRKRGLHEQASRLHDLRQRISRELGEGEVRS
jgi:hypothetical protein